MNEEYLNKEAIIYSANIKASYPEDVDDNTLEYECHKAFLKGACWHESLPLADRLSESEKEWIKKIYNRQINETVSDIQAKFTEQCLLDVLFPTLFTPTEQ